TDVEDKLIKQARKESVTVASLAERVTVDYLENIRKLGVDGIDEMPKATEHIDEIMKLGMNHPMGPLQLADFIGLDTCAHIMNVLADGLHSERYRPCPLLEQLVTAGRLGNKSGHGVYKY
ncbi:MAG: 3-hydroxybutyryl-CoA dehydrogenase, partial [Phycisphaerales bacterium]|nr:3-hydroxybutyryl-CoA dehydrogenase [Phycisphaerales bacterium]